MDYIKIGNKKITVTESMAGKSPDELRGMLLTAYPEIKTAEVRQRTEGEDRITEFVVRAGRKG
jgi:hypothetical protein